MPGRCWRNIPNYTNKLAAQVFGPIPDGNSQLVQTPDFDSCFQRWDGNVDGNKKGYRDHEIPIAPKLYLH